MFNTSAPLNEQSTAYIKLENDDDKRVIFKVRTSAPTKYCVRPNVAIIGAVSYTHLDVYKRQVLQSS